MKSFRNGKKNPGSNSGLCEKHSRKGRIPRRLNNQKGGIESAGKEGLRREVIWQKGKGQNGIDLRKGGDLENRSRALEEDPRD